MDMKDIKGYKGKYAVTTNGQVYSYKLKDFLYLDCNARGYPRVSLSKNGKHKKFLVSRLVAETFIDNPEHKETVDHIDRNPLNNNVTNLRWATRTEQEANKDKELQHAHMIEMAKISNGKRMKKTAMCDKDTGKIIKIFNSCSEAAKAISNRDNASGIISNACQGKKKTAYGYIWKYI